MPSPPTGATRQIGLVGAVLGWDADFLVLTGHTDNGPFTWEASGFPSDPAGLNDTFSDGDAYYQAVVAHGGDPATATSEGLLVTTLQFSVLPAATGLTSISIMSCVGSTCTLVLDRHPNDPGVEDVTGNLGDPVDVTIECQTNPQCDDENPCTDDWCNESDLCVNDPNDSNDPDDGQFCNGHEICDNGQVIIEEGSLPDCNDELPCTTDSCNETLDQCDHELQDGNCLIGDICYIDGSINPANDCEQCDSLLDPESWSLSPPGGVWRSD